MALPVADLEVVKAWAPAKLLAKEGDLRRCLNAASGLIEGYLGRVVVAPDAAAVDIYDGDGEHVRGRYREQLYLRNFPVISVTSVTENGVALTTASGYSTTADVIIDPGAARRSARLIRRTTRSGTLAAPPLGVMPWGWAAGVQNISVTVRAGWGKTSVPDDLVQVAAELTWLIHKEGAKVGAASVGRASMNTTFLRNLSQSAQRILDSYRRFL